MEVNCKLWMIAAAALCLVTGGGLAADLPEGEGRFDGYESVVSETHQASLETRQNVLRQTVAANKFWIKGNWGDTLWCLSALYLDEKTDDANARLLKAATVYNEEMERVSGAQDFRPESHNKKTPWTYFAFGDYLRMLHLFGGESRFFQGRLKPETEAAMKESVWWLVKSKSIVKEASLDYLLVHHGTENHDLSQRPNYYLAAALFKDDPAYKDRRYDDGNTAAKHYEAYNAYFRAWPRSRAMVGLWWEMGSNTYQKYSWPALFNLHDLSPDPDVRKGFKMLLDLAFIEEAQVSVKGRRGGGRSRAKSGGASGLEAIKNLFYADSDTDNRGASHTKVPETTTYQLPAAAIMLRKMAFPAEEPFLIRNRVPGELSDAQVPDGHEGYQTYVEDSALVNYVYRTPHYMLGSTLQNPALSMRQDGEPVLKYSGISRQNRWSGILFDDPDTVVLSGNQRGDNELCAIYTEIAKTSGGRPQHPHWSFQHENVLYVQRIPQLKGMGSYSTGLVSIRFHGRGLEKVEEEGWIFATNGKGFVGVKFLDGGYEWDRSGELASPAGGLPETATRVLMHAGDLDSFASFDAFRAAVLSNPLSVKNNQVTYRPSKDGPLLKCFGYEPHQHKSFRLPRVDGEWVNLRPEQTYSSPYLNGKFGDDRVHVTVGPVKQVFDFGSKK
ncbi:MAG: hypothetical protein ISR84_02395 [Kiritimatiellales bacterium]|nr:hypothetical protein [Kiritimatiellales bacterium]